MKKIFEINLLPPDYQLSPLFLYPAFIYAATLQTNLSPLGSLLLKASKAASALSRMVSFREVIPSASNFPPRGSFDPEYKKREGEKCRAKKNSPPR
jgi:hypothetical protein